MKVSIKQAIVKQAGLMAQKWLSLREEFLREARSTTQKWLNTKKPPVKGQTFKKNSIAEEGPDSVVLRNKRGKIIYSPFNLGIFRVYLQSVHEKESWLEHNSWTVDLTNNNREVWEFVKTGDTAAFGCTLTNGLKARVELKLKEGTLSCQIGTDLVMVEALPPQATKKWLLVKFHLASAGEVGVFGLGENTSPLNKAGQKMILWNTAPIAYKIGANPLYQSWPVVIFQYAGGPAFGLVFDNPCYSSFKFSADGKKMDYAVKDNELSYYILLGPTLPELMRQLGSLTGTLSPLPKWALGYHQSRWSYTPSSRVRQVAAEFRNRDIPCDAIHLDIDYMDRYKCFTWGEDFIDHQGMLRELNQQGFKTICIIDPGLKIEPGYYPHESGSSQEMFITNHNGSFVEKKAWAGPSCFPDFVNPAARTWWGKLVQKFVQSGVDGIWCDMNEPSTFDLRRTLPPGAVHKLSEKVSLLHQKVHNVYGLLMSRATCEGLLEITRLPYVITRSTYLGGQKYATTWTGDNVSSWDHFRASIPMIINLGLSGMPFAGPDIGGFRGEPSPELYERWILQGALYPFSRTHTDRGTADQEPWSFGPEVEKSARKALKLRYRLLPYLYSLLFEAYRSGQPVMRPIFYHSPTTEALRPQFCETEFLLGPYLLVAPLMDQRPARDCYLPPGAWYSWWCRKKRGGGQIYSTLPEEDTDLPLFIRENAVIPVYPEAPSYIPDHSLEDLEIIVAVKDKAEGLAVEYFDRESLLAFRVLVTNRGGSYIECEIHLIRQGNVPGGYQPPKSLYIRMDHRIRSVMLITDHQSHRLLPGEAGDVWTKIAINSPSFPLRGYFHL